MFCATCGAQLAAGSRFCAACGAANEAPAPTARPAPPEEPTFRAPTVGTTSRSAVPAREETSPLAVVSLVLGFVGFCAPVVGGLAAIITGHVARGQIRKAQGALGGGGLALGGLILGYTSTLLMCLFGSLALVGAANEDDEAKRRAVQSVALRRPDAAAVAEEETVGAAGTHVALRSDEVRVDGQPLTELRPNSLLARSGLGELPALLGRLRERKRDEPTDTVRIRVGDEVRFGLLHRVLQTAQTVPYATLALLEDDDEAEPRFLWDGRPELGISPQAALTLAVSGGEHLLTREQAAPVRLSVKRDESGVVDTGALEDALMAVTDALPDQQTITLKVADDVRFEDLLEVLDACTYAGLPYVALRSASAK